MPEGSGAQDSMVSKITMVASAVGVVGLGVLIYNKLYRKNRNLSGDNKTCVRISDVSPEQMEELLDQLVASQKKMKGMMQSLSKKIYDDDVDFDGICNIVRQVNPEDPLAPYGLTIEEFSQLLAIHNTNEGIRKKILLLTSGPDLSTAPTKARLDELIKTRTAEDLIEIHGYMLEQLKQVTAQCEAGAGRKKEFSASTTVDARLVTIAAQAYVGKVVHKRYGLASEDLEALTCHYQSQLQQDTRFFELGTEMRLIVQGLVSAATGQKFLGPASTSSDAGSGAGSASNIVQ